MKLQRLAVFFLIVMALGFGWFYVGADAVAETPEAGTKLKNSFVCMMNNQFMGTEQIPISVAGKTYYGCCQGCAASLKNNRSTRYAFDPYAGREVDKANAYIVKNPNNQNTVLYFESNENYEKYLESKPKKLGAK